MSRFKILIIDDEHHVISSLKRFFVHSDYDITSATTGEAGLEKIRNQSFDLVLLDLKMPGMSGMTVLEKALALNPDLKIIIQTGHGGVHEAVKALKLGATDFLEKSSDPAILRTRIDQVYNQWTLVQANKNLEASSLKPFHFPGLIGESKAMLKLKDMITRIGPTDTTILIQGESGTGKELVARAIHVHSMRLENELVIVDCTTLGEHVFESELFGHKKGSFTGANTSTQGLVRAADQSTLFLDEIGELPLSTQAKLLRVIQEKTIRSVGATQIHAVDFRLVAATNKKLVEEVAEERFRQDLFYRLSSVTLSLPPLRERKGDIPLLARCFLANMQNAMGERLTLDDCTLEILEAYHWPGNIRELENVLRGASIFAEDGLVLPSCLPDHVCGKPGAATRPEDNGIGHSLVQYELQAIRNALELTGNNRRSAALLLEISEATLYRKIKQYRL